MASTVLASSRACASMSASAGAPVSAGGRVHVRVPGGVPGGVSGRDLAPVPGLVVLLLVVLLLVPLLQGCGDLGPIDDVALDEGEPVPALRFGGELPSLPALVRRWSPEAGLGPAVAQWEASWGHPDEGEAMQDRQAANRAAAGQLVNDMPPGETDRLARSLDDVFAALEAVVGEGMPAGLRGPLSDARDARDAARLREGGGDEALRLAHLMETTDHLRRTTPAALAQVLMAGVEEELRRSSGVPAYSEERRTRAHRLLAGAREALATGEPGLALRRAWYAAGLLEDTPPPPGSTDSVDVDPPD